MLAPNTILQDRYRIVRLLGKGGMGAVYEAIDQRVSCVVALKEYLVGPDSEARMAFQREAALLANLRHSSLPKVMDYFDEPQGDFLVMEYIPGDDLAELLALRDAPFPQEQVVLWAIELLKLLEYLHTREPPIVHRDIKPANLKVTKQGEVFLLDFGLAKGAAGQMATIESSKSVAGYTPLYAPLEQILGRGTDPRSDLYSLAATLYHLMTGQAPASAPARFDAVENDRPDPLRPANQLNWQVASDIAALVQNAMALSRKDRPASATEMLLAMEQAVPAAVDRDRARKAERALRETLPPVPEHDPAKPLVTDKDVQFTVFTPQKIKPEKIYPVLAFAHLSKRRADAAADEPDPIEEMKDQAARILGKQRDDYRDAKDPSRQPVPRGGEITFVPVVQGVTFSPPSRSFTWRKTVHREEFDISATRDLDGQTLNGRMTVFRGSVIIAEVELSISIDSRAVPAAERISPETPQSGRRVRQVFASYSHRDEQVVAELAHVAPIFGSRFLMDRTHLEPGEDRREGLQRLIRGADVFQLFWSTNSMRSPDIAIELNYAISLGRPGFILPTYWEEPVPRSPAEGLPPPEIERLHFYRIYPGAISHATFGGVAETQAAMKHTEPAQDPPVVTGSLEMPPDVTPTGVLPPLGEEIQLDGPLMAPAAGDFPSPTETMRTPSPPMVPYPTADDRMIVGSAMATSPRALSTPPPSYAPAAHAPRRKVLFPILGVAAMLLFAAIVAPVWFLMKQAPESRSASVNPDAVPVKNSNTSVSSNVSSSNRPGLPNAAGIAFVYIPAGRFMMGSEKGADDEKPVHSVTISEGFYMGKYEVTQAQWQTVMSSNPSNFKGDNLPVETVSWDDAIAFIARLNAQNDGFTYRLPTEAEWEYACRAGTTGDYAGDLDAMAWYGNNSGRGRLDAAEILRTDSVNYGKRITENGGQTRAVGTKLPNSFGLFDMHGNVYEWCQDWYHDSYNGAPTDGSAWLSGGEQKDRVLRGASWLDYATFLRSAFHMGYPPDGRWSLLGFRVVAVVRTQ